MGEGSGESGTTLLLYVPLNWRRRLLGWKGERQVTTVYFYKCMSKCIRSDFLLYYRVCFQSPLSRPDLGPEKAAKHHGLGVRSLNENKPQTPPDFSPYFLLPFDCTYRARHRLATLFSRNVFEKNRKRRLSSLHLPLKTSLTLCSPLWRLSPSSSGRGCRAASAASLASRGSAGSR